MQTIMILRQEKNIFENIENYHCVNPGQNVKT